MFDKFSNHSDQYFSVFERLILQTKGCTFFEGGLAGLVKEASSETGSVSDSVERPNDDDAEVDCGVVSVKRESDFIIRKRESSIPETNHVKLNQIPSMEVPGRWHKCYYQRI